MVCTDIEFCVITSCLCGIMIFQVDTSSFLKEFFANCWLAQISSLWIMWSEVSQPRIM